MQITITKLNAAHLDLQERQVGFQLAERAAWDEMKTSFSDWIFTQPLLQSQKLGRSSKPQLLVHSIFFSRWLDLHWTETEVWAILPPSHNFKLIASFLTLGLSLMCLNIFSEKEQEHIYEKEQQVLLLLFSSLKFNSIHYTLSITHNQFQWSLCASNEWDDNIARARISNLDSKGPKEGVGGLLSWSISSRQLTKRYFAALLLKKWLYVDGRLSIIWEW